MASFLPVDVVEAAVQVAGTAFHYKRPLQLLLSRAGVPETMWHRYESLSKYQIARNVFGDLEMKGQPGAEIQIKIIEQMVSLRAFPPEVDKASAVEAVRRLRELSRSPLSESESEKRERELRLGVNVKRQEDALHRSTQLGELKRRFYALLTSENPQQRGFDLEQLLKELFRLFELDYTSSYKTETEQVDGAFKFGAFDYLVEAKWTQDETDIATLDSFKSRVSRRITSTRGLFLSISGFRSEVVTSFEAGSVSNVLLMTGEDLVCILEERCALTDALQRKADRAAQHGTVLTPLRDFK